MHYKNINQINELRLTQERDYLKNAFDASSEQMLRNLYAYNHIFQIMNIKIENICDLGCGFGTMSKALAMLGKKVDALDFFKGALKDAAVENSKFSNIKYKVFDIFENELGKNKYNLVFVREFHPFTRNFYGNNQETEKKHTIIMNKIFNSLKKDGHLIIVFNKVNDHSLNIYDHLENKFKLISEPVDERIVFFVSYHPYFNQSNAYFY